MWSRWPDGTDGPGEGSLVRGPTCQGLLVLVLNQKETFFKKGTCGKDWYMECFRTFEPISGGMGWDGRLSLDGAIYRAPYGANK